MSTSNFPKKWLQSSRGLPGSFMNENHHTMTHIWKDDNRHEGMTSDNQTTSTSSTYASHDTQEDDDRRVQQHYEMDHSDLLGQEPRRSILGPHNDDFQSQQANFPDDTDFYSRLKDNKTQHPPPIAAMFPQDHLAGGLYKIDQDPPPHHHGDKDNRQVTELGNDPDPATKAAFQSTTEPIMVPNKDDDAAKPGSMAASVGSNRAIKNQPLVSDPIEDDVDDYDDDADYYTTSELMPATYVETAKSPNRANIETPPFATPLNMDETDAPSANNKDDMLSKQTSDKGNALGANTEALNTNEEQTAPFKASDMYHQQDNQVISPPMNAAATDGTANRMNTDKGPMDEEAPGEIKSQQQSSLSSLPGDNTIQNSLGGIGDKYKNQDFTTPTTTHQPFSPDTSNNAESNDQMLGQQQSDPNMSQTNPSNYKHEGHRRSSLTQSIGKLFGRHHKST